MRLKLENISKSYGSQPVLKDFSLEVGDGEFFFLLGSSGCGKSTLLRMVAGLLDPDEGRIFFDEKDVTKVPAEKRGVGLVFQNYALWPHMTVYENVAFGLRTRGVKDPELRERVGRIIEEVRLQGFEKRYPAELSGGQQQRVALARALVIEPALVLLDEPLSNLDANLRLEMRAELRRIHKTLGLTMLYVTHDQKEALSLADKVALLHEGRLEQLGTPEELYKRPATRFAASFIGETNFIKAEISEKTGDSWVLAAPWGRLTVPSLRAFDLKEGGEVFLGLRPEELSTEGDKARPNFRAKVVENNFLGDVTQLVLEAFGQRLALVKLSAATHLKPGTEVDVWPNEETITAYGK